VCRLVRFELGAHLSREFFDRRTYVDFNAALDLLTSCPMLPISWLPPEEKEHFAECSECGEIFKLCELRMRFLFRVTRHSAFVSISVNTPEGFPSSAHNLLETRQFRPQLREFFRLFREVTLVVTNPMR
jgi:hypothetical protein